MIFTVGSVLVTLSALALGASATPLELIAERASPKCVTVASGYMVTSDNAVGLQNGSEPTKTTREQPSLEYPLYDTNHHSR